MNVPNNEFHLDCHSVYNISNEKARRFAYCSEISSTNMYRVVPWPDHFSKPEPEFKAVVCFTNFCIKLFILTNELESVSYNYILLLSPINVYCLRRRLTPGLPDLVFSVLWSEWLAYLYSCRLMLLTFLIVKPYNVPNGSQSEGFG